MVIFVSQWQNWVSASEIIWTWKPKIIKYHLAFYLKFPDPWYRELSRHKLPGWRYTSPTLEIQPNHSAMWVHKMWLSTMPFATPCFSLCLAMIDINMFASLLTHISISLLILFCISLITSEGEQLFKYHLAIFLNLWIPY
jgi:hypothetical protein